MTIVRESFNSQANATATTTPTVNAPSGVVAGDVLVCTISFNGSPGTITPPADWVQMGFEIGAANPRQGMWLKVASGSEPASYQWQITTAITSGMVIARYSGVDNTTPEDVTAVGSWSAAATAFNFTGVNIVTPGAMLVVGVGVNSASTTINENSTLITQVAEVGGKKCELADGVQAVAGPTGIIAYTFSQSRASAGIVGALRPAATGGGISGSGAVTLDTITRAASGDVAITGGATQTLAGITASASGTVQAQGGVIGTANVTLAGVTRTASGQVVIGGSGSATLSPLSGLSVGNAIITGNAAATLSPLSRTATGAVRTSGMAAQTLASVTVSATGGVNVTGGQARILDGVTGHSVGVVGAAPVLGRLDAMLSGLIAAASGNVTISGQSGAILAAMTGTGSGTVADTTALPISTRKVSVSLRERRASSGESGRTVNKKAEDRVYQVSIDERHLTFGD